MKLETMTPDPDWEVGECEEAVEILSRLSDGLTVKVWGGDWCPDCQNQLPGFAAALSAARIDPVADVEHYPVEKDDEGNKVGPKVEEYGVGFIPTVVIEREGEEVARFVEEEDVPIVVFLARQLEELEASA